jgi:hypothetical protein
MQNFDFVIEGVLIFEAVIIFLLVICVYMVGFVSYIKKYFDAKKIKKIDHFFINFCHHNNGGHLPYAKQPHIIIRSFFRWDDMRKKDSGWQKHKKDLMRTQVLPSAVKYGQARNWGRRFLLVQCLLYYVDATYEKLVIKLVNDRVPVISINAVKVAINVDTVPVLEALVERINKVTDHFQILYIAQLSVTSALLSVIKTKLSNHEDTRLCRTCYRILKKIGPTDLFFEEAARDVQSKDLELKLSAIRILEKTHKEKATPILIQLLSDENWLVRNIAVQSMSHLEKEAILQPLGNALNDEAWWVRVNAAKVLANLGEEGLALLASYQGERGDEKFQEPSYFMKIRNIREDKK